LGLPLGCFWCKLAWHIFLVFLASSIYCRSFIHLKPGSLIKVPVLNFTFMWLCIVTNFFIIKPTRCINFTNLFWHETLHVLDSSSVHHKEFIHSTLSTGICHVDSFRAGPESCLQTCMTYTIAECTVNKLLMMDRRTVRNM
jgi:hypothetical protein